MTPFTAIAIAIAIASAASVAIGLATAPTTEERSRRPHGRGVQHAFPLIAIGGRVPGHGPMAACMAETVFPRAPA